MPASVRIVEEARVAVPAAAALPPEPLRLSALDALWIALPLIQRVLVFDGGAGGDLPPFASVVAALRASLADTLARFPPLAGKVVHLPSTGDAAIDCTAEGVAAGVRFLVAESDDADVPRLAADPDHDLEAFRGLVPALDAGALPAETFAAQVTRLRRGGGVALGVAMHHGVADGRSVWRFLQAWAAACRGEGEADAAAAPPAFDRAALKLPGGEELARSVLRKYAPELPVATMAGVLVRPNLARRTFTFSAHQMRRLKHRIATADPATPPPSSFVAVAALAWVSFVRAKHPAVVSPADEVTLFFLADVRTRLDPPPGDAYFGTCVAGCLARAAARDLLLAGGVGIAAAAAAVQAEVRRAAAAPLALWDWMELVGRVDLERVVNMTGSTRFPAYEAADFGWGAPARTELVTMNHDGQVVLLAGKGGGGGVQASVSIHEAHMDAFRAHFLSYFD
ncbi:hypothetical protein ACP4OV_029351 [Aristida adscensionis]